METLKALLDITGTSEKNDLIRKRLKPSSPALTADGLEFEMCIILLNLGYSKTENVDLTSIETATDFLVDSDHLPSVISESKWLHTHNIKYPDIRVSGKTIRANVLDKNIEGICSFGIADCAQLGWSHNGKYVTKLQPLVTEFSWKNQVTCLAMLIANRELTWIGTLIKLGLDHDRIKELTDELVESTQAFLPDIIRNTIQLRFKYGDDYVSITPVVSHAVLSQIQKLSRKKSLRTRTIHHPRMTNAGCLITALSGYVSVLNYYPHIFRNRGIHDYFNQLEEDDFFNAEHLRPNSFIKALRDIVFEPFHPTLRNKRIARVQAIKAVRLSLYLWLRRAEHYKQHGGVSVSELSNELLKEFIENESDTLLSKLSHKLHEQLGQNKETQVYAYHPKLLLLLKKQIRFLIEPKNGQSDTPEMNTSDYAFMHIKELTVEGMETMSNQYLWGMPSVIALAGLSHEFELNLHKLGFSEIVMEGMALFIHSYTVTSNTSLPEYSRIDRVEGKWIPARPALIAQPKSRMTFDLVFKVKKSSIDAPFPSIEQLEETFPQRYNGGNIPSDKNPVRNIMIKNNLAELLSSTHFHHRSGCWLYPCKFKSQNLIGLAEALNADNTLKPVHIGYAYLESPKLRKGSIAKTHCYAESVLGVARCMNHIDVQIKRGAEFYRNAFWTHKTTELSILMSKY